MCGIAYTSFDAGNLSDVMRRRGMDGYVRREGASGQFHHSLLAINGVQRQPIVRRPHMTVYNGEIYNAAEVEGDPLRDASLMAEGFAAGGSEFLHSLNGDWAVIQENGAEVVAVRDRFGLRPLFRYYHLGRLVYASNIATIKRALEHQGVQLGINEEYPTKGRVPLPSRYLHVQPLPPGTIERATKRAGSWCFTRERWYRPKAGDHGPLEDVFAAAVRCRLHDKSALAVSGGVDSYLLRMYASSTPSYHLDVTGEAEAAHALGASILNPSVACARDIEEVLEQPYYATPPNFFLARAISEQDPTVRVVLTGIGADELFGGYKHHQMTYNEDSYKRVYGIAADAECAGWRAAELEHSIPHHYGYRTDQMFLWHGMEVRHPYLDHRVVETALSAPPDGKKKLRALATEHGWPDKNKTGFAADLRRYIQSPHTVER